MSDMSSASGPPTTGPGVSLVTSSQAGRILGVTPRRVSQMAVAGTVQPALVTPLGRLYARDVLVRIAAERAAQRRGVP